MAKITLSSDLITHWVIAHSSDLVISEKLSVSSDVIAALNSISYQTGDQWAILHPANFITAQSDLKFGFQSVVSDNQTASLIEQVIVAADQFASLSKTIPVSTQSDLKFSFQSVVSDNQTASLMGRVILAADQFASLSKTIPVSAQSDLKFGFQSVVSDNQTAALIGRVIVAADQFASLSKTIPVSVQSDLKFGFQSVVSDNQTASLIGRVILTDNQFASLSKTIPVSAQSDLRFSFQSVVSDNQTASLIGRVILTADQFASLSKAIRISAQSDLNFSFQSVVSDDQRATSGGTTTTKSDLYLIALPVITVQSTQIAHLDGNNPVTRSDNQRARLGEPKTIIVKAENHMLYRGRKIQVLEATGLSIDSSKFAWSATVNLVHWTDFKTLRNGDEFDLVLQGDHYRLMIDDQGLDRNSSPKLGLSLSCVSPTVRLDNDTYSQINRSWTDKKPTEIIMDFLPDDFVIDWQTDDSPIKQYIASGKTIMGVIRELAERIGAIVQTQRDGHTIEIYPFYRVKPEAWATTAIPETHYFREGNLSLKMTWGKIKKWNSVVVGDEEDNPSCEMEVIDDSKLRLYPVPFREMDVGTSHLSGVYIGTLRYGEAIERECNLEFKEGKTSVKFPIYKINKFDWGENLDLGTPDYTIDQKDLIVSTDNTFSGHSLASIEYVKRFYECAIRYPKGTTVQFLAIEKS